MEENHIEQKVLLKVGRGTDATRLAQSINAAYEEDPNRKITLRSIGSSAINQATKAVIISGAFFSQKGLKVHIHPYFTKVPGNNEAEPDKEATAIEYTLVFTRV